ncbi:MAG: P22 phage major capsid protein family protein [Pseudomonadota bacterium]
MPNAFTRAEKVMFDSMIDGFDDSLVIAKAAEVMPFGPPEAAERSGDRFWLPQPLISASYDGFDQTANFGDGTELSVPVSIGFHKSSPIKFTAKNLRNETFLANKAKAAKQKLASDINLALYNTVALQGAIFVKRTVAPTGFDDVALADAAMTEIGVPGGDRYYFAAPRVANAMAGDLAKRGTFNGAVQNAYERATLGIDVAGFDVYKNDQSIRLAAATGGVTTVNGANQRWVPKATSTAATGEIANVDNRYSDLVITATTYANIKAGDAFTIAGVNSVHMVTKQDTGQLQTFRVISKPAANTIRVAPAIISNGGATQPEKEYQNVTADPAGGAAITWLNTTAAEMNPFFKKESLLLVPGSYSVDPEDGWQVMRATTDLGVAITYTRQGEINDLSVKARWDVDFGTSLTNPQMAGVEMFNQA